MIHVYYIFTIVVLCIASYLYGTMEDNIVNTKILKFRHRDQQYKDNIHTLYLSRANIRHKVDLISLGYTLEMLEMSMDWFLRLRKYINLPEKDKSHTFDLFYKKLYEAKFEIESAVEVLKEKEYKLNEQISKMEEGTE